MIRNIALFLVMLVPLLAQAQLDSQFTFNGQNAEVLVAEKAIKIVTPETVQVPSTCYRQVPAGQHEVCRNETRYRQECSWIPSSERCWNDQDRVCHPVTRYRQECHNGPSRQECHTGPARQECHNGPSREVCTDRPTRRVCTDRPTRRVCRTRPDGREHCTEVGGGQHCTEVGGGRSCNTVPGERICRSVPGERICRSVPGERVCRNVSYTDQECTNVTRRRCETVPGRNDCRSIPYSERVCEMETRYETQSYACTRTETVNRTAHKTIKAETNVQIITNGLVEEFPVAVSIKEVDSKYSAFSIEAKLLKEPTVFVVLQKKAVKVAEVTEKEITLKAELVLEVLSQEMLPISFPTEIVKATISEETKKLVVQFAGPLSAAGEVDLKITYKPFLGRTRTVAELKAAYPSEKIEVGMVEDKAALSIDLKNNILSALRSKNMLMAFTLSSEISIQGELMNQKKPLTSKSYEGNFVQLQ